MALGAWAALGSAGAIGLAAALIGVGRVPSALVAAAAGAIAAGACAAAVVVSTELRYGLFDTDYAGKVALLPVAVVAATVGLSSWLASAGLARYFALVVVCVAIVAVGLLAIDSAPGASDGISASGSPAIAAFVVAGGYGLLAAGVFVGKRAKSD